ncbi:MAG: DUF4340 domain-containing protein [Gammaproteobacteria bacterium]
MQKKLFLWLTVATAVIVLLAALIQRGYRSSTAMEVEQVALTSDWGEQLPQAAAIRLDSPAGEVNLNLDGERWRVAERHDYPADNGKVWKLLEQVGDITLITAKTDNPKLHQRLGLDSRDQANAESMQVTIRNAAGEVMADFLIGKDRPAAGQGDRQFYLRRSAENQTWVAQGQIRPSRLASAWLDRNLIDIAQSRMREVTIQHPDKPPVKVGRESVVDPFVLEAIPAGRSVKTTELTAIAYGLQKLQLSDVNQAETAGLQWEDTIKVDFKTFDGLMVTVRVQAKDLGIVGQFVASGEGDAAAEAEALNHRLTPWVFVIPNHTVSTFTREQEELLEPLNEGDQE